MMSYSYQKERESLFTDEGQRMFLKVRDFAIRTLRTAGAVRCGELTGAAGGGDSWQMLACVDRLLELGELREVTPTDTFCQGRVFVQGRGT